MSSKLDEAGSRLYDAAVVLAQCRDEVNRTDGPTAWAALKEADAAHEQAARDFAAAEILERYQRPRPPPGSDENAMTDDEWLRDGGLAQQQKEAGG